MKKPLLPEEVLKLKEFRDRNTQYSSILGELSMQKVRIELEEEKVKKELEKFFTEEVLYTRGLEEKYGLVAIDLEEGVAVGFGS
jgi:hypothetical protein